jgi:hypothetical protein
MGLMYTPEADASRVYYGTDTRLGTILIGAALAFVWSPGHRTASPRWVGSFTRDLACLGSLGAIGYVMVTWNEFVPQLYRGGFTVVALLTVVAVAVASHPGALTKSLLGNLPMRWLGRRSYSIYLWHWPVFMLTRPDLDVKLDGMPLFALRMGLTLCLAIASYGLIEKPVRDGALTRAWTRMKEGVSTRSFGRAAAGIAGLMLPVLLAGAVVAGTLVPRNAPKPPAQAALAGAGHVSTTASAMHPMEGLDLSETSAPIDPAATQPPAPAPPAAADPALAGAPPAPGKVTAIGDSVMLIAKEALAVRLGGAIVDADIGRQTKAVIETAQGMKDRGELGDSVIVHMGTNGLITVKQLNQLMDILKDVPHVALVNVKVDRPWEDVNNRMLAENVGRFPNAKLVDWKGTASEHPEAFYKDGVHLRPSGVGMYVDLLSGSVAG